MDAFRFEEHRREYATTRVLVRTALSHNSPATAPEDWRFQTNAFGKPATDPECGLEFNLSNCEELVVCALTEGCAVGVDAEPITRAAEVLELAAEVCSTDEHSALEALPATERADRALTLWTLKEAYSKARGLGLSLPMPSFSFLFGGAEGLRLTPPADDNRPEGWRFCLLDHAGHRIALAVAHPQAPQLELWELQSAEETPSRLPDCNVRWLPAR